MIFQLNTVSKEESGDENNMKVLFYRKVIDVEFFLTFRPYR